MEKRTNLEITYGLVDVRTTREIPRVVVAISRDRSMDHERVACLRNAGAQERKVEGTDGLEPHRG
jgi:hypothetical protein